MQSLKVRQISRRSGARPANVSAGRLGWLRAIRPIPAECIQPSLTNAWATFGRCSCRYVSPEPTTTRSGCISVTLRVALAIRTTSTSGSSGGR